MSFTSIIIAVLVTYLHYVLFGVWKDLNEALHSQSAQTSSAQTNVVYLAVPLPLRGAVVERLCSLLSVILAVPQPRRWIVASPKAGR